jgi:hypothetical protein
MRGAARQGKAGSFSTGKGLVSPVPFPEDESIRAVNAGNPLTADSLSPFGCKDFWKPANVDAEKRKLD